MLYGFLAGSLQGGNGPSTKGVTDNQDPNLSVLGGFWVVVNGLISRVTILTTHIRGLITPLITTHEPPSSNSCALLTELGLMLKGWMRFCWDCSDVVRR